MSSNKVIRYVLVGCGGRGISMFAQPLLKNFSHCAELVGICDVNEGRMAYLNQSLGSKVPAYKDFDRMLKETKPDVVIVSTKDALHHEFIIKAFDAGCDAISEKPMTTDDAKCRAVLAAEKRTGKKVTVTFNYRFVPYVTKVRELLAKGIIGKVLSVDFNYQLDRSHGADYFRRWHRKKENSGGLLVHKSTHHFDIANWFLGQDPTEVFALGSLQFYGPTRKERGKTCRQCDHKKTCEFFYDITTPTVVGALIDNNALYAKVEHFDGYHRDGCVFDPEINIEDTMNLAVRYSGGVQMSYSLNAHCIYEGWRMALNGTEGRLECSEWHSGPHVVPDKKPQNIIIYRPDKSVETIGVLVDHSSGHGGGDARLHKMLFDQPQPDPLGHMASSRAGAMSILIGIAGNHSIATGKPIHIADLLKG
ncbi:MAG: Gfo/Idh/MocA family protein [Verrucomicrobiia bacterium]